MPEVVRSWSVTVQIVINTNKRTLDRRLVQEDGETDAVFLSRVFSELVQLRQDLELD